MKITQDKFIFAQKEPMLLDSGQTLSNVEIAYESYGELNSDRSNAILIIHALTGDAHVAGKYNEHDKKPGWWDIMVGSGKPIDTDKYFVLCSNVLGGCNGSTGPDSINPKTGEPYGMSFPIITMRDMVVAQKELVGHLGINKLHSVLGGSMGGMQVLEWSRMYPEMVSSAIAIATTAKLSAQSIAFNEVGRQAIIADPNWNKGNYYNGHIPDKGLAIARMLGHITYLSDEQMHHKFGRKLQDNTEYQYDFLTEFQVESYLHYQGERFTQRFSANTYIYLTKALDYFDMSDGYDSLKHAFSDATCKYLVLSYSSDWLFPAYHSKEIVNALRSNGVDVSFCEIESSYGHDSFLLENEKQERLIRSFLENV